jgi:hypothetical protein
LNKLWKTMNSEHIVAGFKRLEFTLSIQKQSQ